MFANQNTGRMTDQNVSSWSHEFLITKYHEVWCFWHLGAEQVRSQTKCYYSNNYGKPIHATILIWCTPKCINIQIVLGFLHSLGGRFRNKFPNVQSPHHQIIGRLCDWQITQPFTCSRSPGTESFAVAYSTF